MKPNSNSHTTRLPMRHFATLTLMLNVGVAGIYAQQRPAMMTSSGTGAPSANNLQYVAPRAGDIPASASHSLLVYVITGNSQFGAVDLHSGKFLPIGPALPTEVGGGLAQGPGKALLTLGFSGNLIGIDPVTGSSSVVGRTGLGDCTTPASPCGPNSANGIGRLHERLYAT